MADRLLDCAVISSDRLLVAKAARLMSDRQRGVGLVAQYTTPIADIDKAGAQQIRDSAAQVILLDLGDDPAAGLRLARFLAEDHPARTFVVTGPIVAPEVLLEAMRVGASEYLTRPIEDADLAAALTRATRRLAGAEGRDTAQPGHILAVYGAKGGVGVTTAATNLAIAISEETQKPTALVDLDLDMGSTAVLLGLRPRYSVLDVVKNLHRLDRDLLASYAEHHASGVHVLAAPAQMSPANALSRENTRSLLQTLRRHYDCVVVDLDHALSAVTLAALESADTILVLTTPDVASLNNTKRALATLQAVAHDARRIHVVINRRRSTDVITSGDVKKTLGHDVFSTLAEESDVVTDSVNTGRPAVLRSKSKYARSVRQLSEQLLRVRSRNGKSAPAEDGDNASGLFARFRRDRNG